MNLSGTYAKRKADLIRSFAARPALLFVALIVSTILFVASASAPARATTMATVSITADYVAMGGTVSVTVTDAGGSTAAIITAEASGKTAYLLPVGSSGDTFVFQTMNPLVVDRDGDGSVTASDLTISVTDAIPISVVPVNGVFTVRLTVDVTSPISFTVAYNADQIDTLPIKVTSTSDLVGFDLTLRETAADSGVFTGTFETGASTVTTNATDPLAAARPDIKAAHGNVVTVTYTDPEPLSLVSDTILVDGVAPTITLLSPAHNSFEQTFSSFLEARVTDADSGVDLGSIRFHYDGDGNNTFTEPGTVLLIDPTATTPEPTGVVVRVRIPSSSSDGLRTWYVTASDAAGTVGQSDAVAATNGNQVHIFTSDQNPPLVSSAVAGEWYDTVSNTVKTGSRTSVHVTFSEKISVPSIIAAGFRINGAPALSVQTYTTLPNDVFLTVESYPTVSPVVLMIDPGSVTDLAGLKTSLVPVTITDQIAPLLTINFDHPVTNSLVRISVVSEEPLVAAPSITVNGITRGVPTKTTDQRWELQFDVASLTGLDAGQGVKTVGATGFDIANNQGTAPAVTFQVDNSVVGPTLTPTGAAPVSESFPDITATYAAEAGEYDGDTHIGMSIVLATLDGDPVASLMSSDDAGVTWTLKGADVRPDGYEKGIHVFEIQAVDAAGNKHEIARTVFEVDVDPPLPPPVVDPAPAPAEETPEDPPPAVIDAPVEEPVEGSEPDAEPSGGVDLAATNDQPTEDEPNTASVVEEDLAGGTGSSTVPEDEAPEPDAPAETPGDVDAGSPAETDSPVSVAVEVDEASGVADDAGAGEPGIDPGIDREAEQAALDLVGAEEADHASSTAEETGGTIFGCNIPLGGSGAIGAEYALLGVGLLGLGFRRPVGALRDLLWPARSG